MNVECLGIGKGFVFIVVLSSLKSEINLTVPLFLGIIKVWAIHWLSSIFFNTPILTSLLRVGLWILGIGKGYEW